MSTEPRLTLLDRHLRAENARSMEDTLATLTPDCVLEDLAMGRTYRRHGGAAEHYHLWWEAFAPTVTPQRVFWTRDGHAVAETRWRGYHSGQFLAIDATGREIDVPVAIFVTFGEDDLMAGERFYYDLSTIRRQLFAG